jgi:transposase InsO family protein
MAQVMGVKTKSLDRQRLRLIRGPEGSGPPRGRSPSVPAEVRLKLRNCYVSHYKQWGPRTLACWAGREGLGNYSPGTISAIIADLKDRHPPREKPRRYEITASNVMWSEDGAGFREFGLKKELLLVQDECSRFKVNTRLANGPARADDVCDYLREAFERYGAPLVLKHDGGSIFHEEKVQKLLDEYDVVSLKSPARYPPFNGKMERSIRDLRGFERAMQKQEGMSGLKDRIVAAVHDLNEERPRPMLGGKTAHEAYENGKTTLPDRFSFRKIVQRVEEGLMAQSCTRKDRDDSRRKAVELVLWRQGFIKESTDVSTYFLSERVTR